MDVEPEASTMAEALGEWTVATAMTEAVATEATSSGDLAGFSAATAQCKMMRFDREYGVSDAYQGMREVFGGRPVINTTSLGVGSRLVLCGRKSGQQAVSVEVISCYDVKDIRNQVPIRGSLLHIRVVADHLHTPADKKASLGSPAHWTVNSRNWVWAFQPTGCIPDCNRWVVLEVHKANRNLAVLFVSEHAAAGTVG